MEFVLLLLVMLIIVVAIVASRFIDNSNPFPVQRKPSLFSQVERGFLSLLETAVGTDYKVMNRVKLADLLELKHHTSEKNKRTTQLKMNAKYLDFVLCNPQDMSIVAVIDLVNNNSRDGHKAAPDWFVSGALETAGIPYLRMKIKAGYSTTDIQQALAARLGKAVTKPEPLLKGFMKKGPTRPLRSLKPAIAEAPPVPALSPSQIKAQSTALIQAS